MLWPAMIKLYVVLEASFSPLMLVITVCLWLAQAVTVTHRASFSGLGGVIQPFALLAWMTRPSFLNLGSVLEVFIGH